MTDIETTTTGETMDTETIDAFAASLRGELIRPLDPGYDATRSLYNAMIDKRPALIARCIDVADVIATVRFAREHAIPLAIRGGGHNGPGLASVDGGIMLDLSPMNGTRVDPIARTVRVEGGCTWGDVDHATHEFGLAVPSGIIASTGVGGLSLGGGTGHLSRQFGLTIDHLLAADVVLADGSLVTASEDEHPDLFWALRGGGGNFGVVTSFLFRLRHVDTVVSGPTLWPVEQAGEVLRWYRDFIREAPEDLNGFFTFLQVPPVPHFPEELHLQPMCGVVWCYTGATDQAAQALAPALEVGTPALHGVQEMPYPAMQSMFDALYPPGMQWYWKADFVRDLPEAAIEQHVEFGSNLPSMFSTMHLYPINGAVHQHGPTETAFRQRDVTWNMVMVGVDPDPANSDRITQWAQEYWDAVHPYSAGGAYLNMIMNEGQARIRDSFGENYARLAEVKAAYDPTNVFRINQNIEPAGAMGSGVAE